MSILNAVTAFVCAYDALLIPFVVFRRTSGRRVFWADSLFTAGVVIALLLKAYGRITTKGTPEWEVIVSLTSALLIAASLRWLTRNPHR